MAFHRLEEFQSVCSESLKTATGKVVMPFTGHKRTSTSAHRILIRVGLLGPALGGQCVIDMPLLTALNLCSVGLSGKNYTAINNDNDPTNEGYRKQLLGIPSERSSRTHKCMGQYVKTIDIDLGPIHNHLRLQIGVNTKKSQQHPHGSIRLKVGDNSPEVHSVDADNKVTVPLKESQAIIEVIDQETINLDFDETAVTLGVVPPNVNENHIVTEIEGKPLLIKGASSLVKSRLLELANQVAPYTIPTDYMGDISTPQMIPDRLRTLNLPELEKYEVDLIIMGIGDLVVSAELTHIAGLSPKQLNILKGLFNFTFYHPELKKIFG